MIDIKAFALLIAPKHKIVTVTAEMTVIIVKDIAFFFILT